MLIIMNLGVTHNWGHFQWLLIFLIHVFKQTFLLNFIIIFEREGQGGNIQPKFRALPEFGSLPLVLQNVRLKLNPWAMAQVFIDTELRFIVFIIDNKKFQHGLVVLVYISRAIHKKNINTNIHNSCVI